MTPWPGATGAETLAQPPNRARLALRCRHCRVWPYDLFDANDIAIHHRQEPFSLNCIVASVGQCAHTGTGSLQRASDALATRRFAFSFGGVTWTRRASQSTRRNS